MLNSPRMASLQHQQQIVRVLQLLAREAFETDDSESADGLCECFLPCVRGAQAWGPWEACGDEHERLC